MGDSPKFRAYRRGNKENWIEATRGAIVGYEARVGIAPTLILVHTDNLEHLQGFPAVRSSKYVLANELWLTNDISAPDFYESNEPSNDLGERMLPEKPETKPRGEGKKRVIGIKIPICPVCCRIIEDFESLEHWPGWSMGIEPPYWNALRQYVFERDFFTCQVCGVRFPKKKLVAHHIIPKEDGGIDSAKNLITVCLDHHLDDKPLFEDLDTRNGSS